MKRTIDIRISMQIIILMLCTQLSYEVCFGAVDNLELLDLMRHAMIEKKDTQVSAQVWLRSATGKTVDPDVSITADNLAEFAPTPATVASASQIFRKRGFEVGPMVGVSFSVTGSLRVFEEFFGMKIQPGEDGAYEFVARDKTIGHELPNSELPQELRNFVAWVVFPLPPDFGPGNF